MSSIFNNTKNQSTDLNDYITLNPDGSLGFTSNVVVPTITVNVINAQEENIDNRTDYNITGFIHATSDVISNYGQSPQYSLNTTAQQTNTNTQAIATNTTNIATNTTNIATNTQAIATNTTNIATLTSDVAGKVNKSGDTMTGILNMNNFAITGLPPPTQNNQPARKQDADSAFALATTAQATGVANSGAIGVLQTEVNTLEGGLTALTAELTALEAEVGSNYAEMTGEFATINTWKSGLTTTLGACGIVAGAVVGGITAGKFNATDSTQQSSFAGGMNTKRIEFPNGDFIDGNTNQSEFKNVDIYGTLSVLPSITLDPSGIITGNNIDANNKIDLDSVKSKTQNITADASGSTFSGNVSIEGNLNIMGTNTSNNSEVNVYDGYVKIIQNPADGINPALSISSSGGSASIMEVLDSDSNIKLKVNQDCDLDLNNGKMIIDSGTGNIYSAGNISNDTTSLNALHTGKFDKPTGTISQYIRGDGSLNTFPSLGGMSALNIVNNKCLYVSASTGNDSNNAQSEQNAVASIQRALDLADGSGYQIAIFAGTYNESVSCSKTNISILGVNRESGGLINCSGTWTISNASSSVRLYGLAISTLNHTGAGGLFIEGCKINTALNSSSSGYLEVKNSDLQGSGLGAVNITGSGLKVFTNAVAMGFLTINNASAQVSLNNNLTSSPITLTSGILGIGNSVVYSAGALLNAITTTSGILIMDRTTCLTPAGGNARISIGASTSYSIRGSVFDRLNSSILGTSTFQEIIFDRLRTTNGRIDATLNCNNIAYGKDVATNGSVFDFGDSPQSIILPKGTTGQQPSGVAGMIRYNTTNNQFEGYTTSWGQIGGSSFNPTITSATVGDLLYYNGTNWINGYYIKAPTVQFASPRLISFTSSMATPFNLTATGSQFQAYNDSGLTNLAYDTGVLNGSYTFNFNGVLTNGNTYYFRGRYISSGGVVNANSLWSATLTYTMPSQLFPVGVYANFDSGGGNVPTSSDTTPNTIIINGSTTTTQTQRLNIVNGIDTQNQMLTGSSIYIVLDYGGNVNFTSASTLGQVITAGYDKLPLNTYDAFTWSNTMPLRYWNGSNWITFYTTTTYGAGTNNSQTQNFSFTPFTARYIAIARNSNGYSGVSKLVVPN